MKTLSVYLATAAIALCAVVGCEDSISTSPTSNLNNGTQQTITTDQALEKINPELLIAENGRGGYSLSFEAYAVGQSNSPEMETLRSLRSVTFDVRTANGILVESKTTEEIPTSGIKDETTNSASLTATAGVDWAGTPAPGSYVVMIVRSENGMLTRQKSFDDVRN